MKRRQFLRVIGTGGVVVAAGTSACGFSAGKATPELPWHHAGSRYPDPLRRALSYAILAPNPHNRQPWQVAIDDAAKSLTLYCDLQRRLPETDPFDRQILIGLGCFTEILRLAALEDGYEISAQWFPEGLPEARLDQRPVARFEFLKTDVAGDPLFEQVLNRRSNKEPFDLEQIPGNRQLMELLAVAPSAGGSVEPERVARLRDLAWRGHEIETRTTRTLMESIRLMRIGEREIAANPDGIDLDGAMIGLLHFFGMLTREKMADPDSTAFSQGLEMYAELHAATPAFVWLVSPDNGRMDQVTAGMEYLRLNLKATAMGIAMHPVSQTLQEYTEMAQLYRQVHDELDVAAPSRIQMLARIGFNEPPKPSPRWPLETRLIES